MISTAVQPKQPSSSNNILHECTILSNILGIIIGGGLVLGFALPSNCRLAWYVSYLSLFHFLEFLLTARFHPSKANSASFLLNNSHQYILAILAALCEYSIIHLLFPRWHLPNGFFFKLGIWMIILGQFLRTRAMVDAGSSFTHDIATEKVEEHCLVTSGVYAYMRHPSYLGYFMLALGTQFLLGNVLCVSGYCYVLYKFFTERIEYEERQLDLLFPQKYAKYRSNCWSGIPGMP